MDTLNSNRCRHDSKLESQYDTGIYLYVNPNFRIVSRKERSVQTFLNLLSTANVAFLQIKCKKTKTKKKTKITKPTVHVVLKPASTFCRKGK